MTIDATVGEELHLFGSVADEGLPRSGTWPWDGIIKGPGP